MSADRFDKRYFTHTFFAAVEKYTEVLSGTLAILDVDAARQRDFLKAHVTLRMHSFRYGTFQTINFESR